MKSHLLYQFNLVNSIPAISNYLPCKEDHVEDCIINVIRNCYEVGLFGDVQTYEGSTLQYLMKVQAISLKNPLKLPRHIENDFWMTGEAS